MKIPISLAVAVATTTVTVVSDVVLVSNYKNEFKKLSESMTCFNKMMTEFDVNVSPFIEMQCDKILSVVDDYESDIKMGFNTPLTTSLIVKFHKKGITINDIRELNEEVKKVISYTYMRYGITK